MYINGTQNIEMALDAVVFIERTISYVSNALLVCDFVRQVVCEDDNISTPGQ